MIMEFNITMLYTGIQHLSCSNLFYVKLVIYLCRCMSVTVAFCTFDEMRLYQRQHCCLDNNVYFSWAFCCWCFTFANATHL